MSTENEIKVLIEEGLVLFGEGRYDRAKSIWEKVLELDPNNEVAHDYLETILEDAGESVATGPAKTRNQVAQNHDDLNGSAPKKKAAPISLDSLIKETDTPAGDRTEEDTSDLPDLPPAPADLPPLPLAEAVPPPPLPNDLPADEQSSTTAGKSSATTPEQAPEGKKQSAAEPPQDYIPPPRISEPELGLPDLPPPPPPIAVKQDEDDGHDEQRKPETNGIEDGKRPPSVMPWQTSDSPGTDEDESKEDVVDDDSIDELEKSADEAEPKAAIESALPPPLHGNDLPLPDLPPPPPPIADDTIDDFPVPKETSPVEEEESDNLIDESEEDLEENHEEDLFSDEESPEEGEFKAAHESPTVEEDDEEKPADGKSEVESEPKAEFPVFKAETGSEFSSAEERETDETPDEDTEAGEDDFFDDDEENDEEDEFLPAHQSPTIEDDLPADKLPVTDDTEVDENDDVVTEPPQPQTATPVECNPNALLREFDVDIMKVTEMLQAGKHETSLRLLEALALERPTDPKPLIAFDLLINFFYRSFIDDEEIKNAVPSLVVDQDEMKEHFLTAEAAYLISQMDGLLTNEEMIGGLGIGRLEGYRIISYLVEQGLVVLDQEN